MEDLDNNYQVYLRSVLNLAGTIVIKSHESALLLNTYIDTYFGNGLFNKEDLSTWKYYMNLCGEYFSTDTVMMVKSSDTLENIEFTKDNLAIHRNTALDHRHGTQQYKELVERYPMQEQLIKGILYPTDMSTLLNAPNMSIVGWGSEFVEPHEYQLMDKVNDFVSGYLDRWYVEGFKYTDDLYIAAILACITSKLPSIILQERAAAHKTRFAHSYHIYQYLDSHSKIGNYADYMTRTQLMFAYRNIAYIERNSGTQENFDWIVEQILTARSVPIAKFDMRHDVSALPQELTATLDFNKKPINTRTNIDGRASYSLSQLLDLEEKADPANIVDRDLHYEDITRSLVYANRDEMPTKVFESTIVDYTDSEQNKWINIALNNWAWLAYKNQYVAYISFQAPSTGDTFTLSVKDAFTLYVYCIIKSFGYDIDYIPLFFLNKCVKLPSATKSDLRSVCSRRVSDEFIDVLHSTMPALRKCVSVVAFNQYSRQLFRAANAQWSLVCQNEMNLQRAMAEGAASRLWADEVISLADAANQTYGQWFVSRNLDMDNYNQEELSEIASLILERSVGNDFNDKASLKSIQRAMCSILTGLSSYSIQIGSTINDGPILPSGMIAVRADDFRSSVDADLYVPIHRVRALETEAVPHHTASSDLGGLYPIGEVSIKSKAIFNMVIPAIPEDSDKTKNAITFSTNMNLNIGMSATADPEPLPINAPKTINVMGMAGWLRMPEEQRYSAKSAWRDTM